MVVDSQGVLELVYGVNTRQSSAELAMLDRQLRSVFAKGVWSAPRVAE